MEASITANETLESSAKTNTEIRYSLSPTDQALIDEAGQLLRHVLNIKKKEGSHSIFGLSTLVKASIEYIRLSENDKTTILSDDDQMNLNKIGRMLRERFDFPTNKSVARTFFN